VVRGTVDYLGGSLLDTAAGNFAASGTMVIAGNQLTQSISVTANSVTIALSLSGSFTDYGAYIIFTQNGNGALKRVPVIIRKPVLATETIGPALGTAPPYAEVDQWTLVTPALITVRIASESSAATSPIPR